MFKELNREFLTGFHSYIAQECAHKKIRRGSDRAQTYPDAGTQQGIHEQGSVCKLQITERIRNTQLPIHERDKQTDAVRGDTPTLQLIRDAFLFSCFTGLSYIDIKDLTLKHPAGE